MCTTNISKLFENKCFLCLPSAFSMLFCMSLAKQRISLCSLHWGCNSHTYIYYITYWETDISRVGSSKNFITSAPAMTIKSWSPRVAEEVHSEVEFDREDLTCFHWIVIIILHELQNAEEPERCVQRTENGLRRKMERDFWEVFVFFSVC